MSRVAWLFVAACAAGRPVASPTGDLQAVVQVPDHLPSPFSVDEVRAAMPVGTVWRFRETTPEGSVVLTWEVVEADAETVTIARSRGHASPETSTTTFDALLDAWRFPVADTVRWRDERTLRWGQATGWTYRRRVDVDGAVHRETYFFADRQPGPPVWVSFTRANTEVLRRVKVVERP